MKRAQWMMMTLIGLAAAGPLNAAEPAAENADAAAESVPMKYEHRLGEVYCAEIESTVVGSMEMFANAPPQRFVQVYRQYLATECIEVREDGAAIYEVTLPRVAMRMTVMGMNIEFDSKSFNMDDADNPAMVCVGKIFNAMVGMKYRVLVDAEGKAMDILDLEASIARITEKIGNDPACPMNQIVAKQMLDMLSDDSILQQMRAVERARPTGENARVGQTWEHDWKMPMPMFGGMTINGQAAYKLVGFEEHMGRRCARIEYTQSFETTPKEPNTDADNADASDNPVMSVLNRMQMDMKMSDGTGVAWWDLERMHIVESQETSRMDITMNLAADEQSDDEAIRSGMKIRHKLRVSVRMRMLDSVDAISAAPTGFESTTQPAS